jgi:hypothetical protein
MNFYDEAIEAKHGLQLEPVDKRRRMLELMRGNKSVQEVATPDLVKGVLYDHDISVLEDADPYFWAPRITQMVLATGQQLPATVQFDASWLNGKAGYWWFGRSSPLVGVSTAGERKYVNALLWNMDPNGSVSVETFHVIGRNQYPLGSLTWDEGESLADAMSRAGTLERELMQTPDLILRQMALNLAKRAVSLEHELIDLATETKKKHEEFTALAKQLGREDRYDISKIDRDLAAYRSREVAEQQRTERFEAEYHERLDEWCAASKNALQVFACGCLWLKQKIITVAQAALTRSAQRRLGRA